MLIIKIEMKFYFDLTNNEIILTERIQLILLIKGMLVNTEMK